MAPVGQFRVRVRLFPRDGTEPPSLDALVDTGAGYTVVPRAVFETLGCEPHLVQRVRLADGRVEEWPLAQVELECEGRRAVTPVLVGPHDAQVLLGATTLEELGLGIDPLNRRLVPVDLYLAGGDPGTLDRVFQFIMRRFKETGAGPHYTELAAAHGVPVDEGRRLLHDVVQAFGPSWLHPERGFEATAMTWLFPGKTVRVDAPCLDCNEPLSFEMRDGEFLRVEPATMVGHFNQPRVAGKDRLAFLLTIPQSLLQRADEVIQ